MISRLKIFLAFCFVILILIVLHAVGFLRPIERLVRGIVEPGSRALYEWSVFISGEKFDTPDDLAQAYKKLLEKYTETQIDTARLTLLEDENTELKSQLSFFNKENTDHVGAHVIGKSIDPLSSTIIIDAGSELGIRDGDPVIAGSGVLVGLITHVEEKRATVRLIDDNQSRVGVTLISRDKSIGLLEGGFGISVQMTFIPQNETVVIGDIVVTSGLSEHIPRGLLIGVVQSVEKQPYQPFQKAVVEPSVKLNHLLLVSIITNT